MNLETPKNNINNFGKGVMQIDCFRQKKKKHIRKVAANNLTMCFSQVC